MFSFLKKKKKYEPVVINAQDNDYINDFIYKWNIQYPIDYWYRKRYSIAFGSKEHRGISIFDIKLEYEEFLIFEKMKSRKPYIEGDWIDTSSKSFEDEMTNEQKLALYKKEFEEIDWDKYKE